MAQVLLVVLGVYLAACYGYGMYLVLRLVMSPGAVRPTPMLESMELVRKAKRELEVDFPEDQRIAA